MPAILTLLLLLLSLSAVAGPVAAAEERPALADNIQVLRAGPADEAPSLGLGTVLWWRYTGRDMDAVLAAAWAEQRLPVLDREQADLRLAQAGAELALGLEQMALTTLASVPEQQLEPAARAGLRLQLASIHLAAGRYAQAADVLAVADGSDADPGSSQAAGIDLGVGHWLRADLLRRDGDYGQAADHLHAVPADHPLAEYAQFNGALDRFRAGAPDTAMQALLGLVASPAYSPEQLMLREQARLSLAAMVDGLGAVSGGETVTPDILHAVAEQLVAADGQSAGLRWAMLLQGRQQLAAGAATQAARWFRGALVPMDEPSPLDATAHGLVQTSLSRPQLQALAVLPWALEQAQEPQAALLAYDQAATGLAAHLVGLDDRSAAVPHQVATLLASLQAPKEQVNQAVQAMAGPAKDSTLLALLAAPRVQQMLQVALRLQQLDQDAGSFDSRANALVMVAEEQVRRFQLGDSSALEARVTSLRQHLRQLQPSLAAAVPESAGGEQLDLAQLATRLARLRAGQTLPDAELAALENRLARLQGLLYWQQLDAVPAYRWQLRKHWTTLARAVLNLDQRLTDLNRRSSANTDPSGVPAQLQQLAIRVQGLAAGVRVAQQNNEQQLVATIRAALDKERREVLHMAAWVELSRARLADQTMLAQLP